MDSPCRAALNDARVAVRQRQSTLDAPLIALAAALGSSRPRPATLRAIHAVLDRVERPDAFTTDQEAWEAYGASGSTFLTWKNKIHGLLLSVAIDSISQDDVLEFTASYSALHSVAAERGGCMSSMPVAVASDADETVAVELANRNARALLRDHASAFVARNGAEATFEGWIAQLHPENVQIDARLKSEGSEHLQIWHDAVRSSPIHPSHRAGLVELSVGLALALAVTSIDVALWLLDVGLSSLGDSLANGRCAVAERIRIVERPASAVLLPAVLVVASLEAASKLASAATRLCGTLAVASLSGAGGALLTLLTLSPRTGRHAAARLHAAAPRLRRRLRHLAERLKSQGAAMCTVLAPSSQVRSEKASTSRPFAKEPTVPIVVCTGQAPGNGGVAATTAAAAAGTRTSVSSQLMYTRPTIIVNAVPVDGAEEEPIKI